MQTNSASYRRHPTWGIVLPTRESGLAALTLAACCSIFVADMIVFKYCFNAAETLVHQLTDPNCDLDIKIKVIGHGGHQC
jgi:hypothetical protein